MRLHDKNSNRAALREASLRTTLLQMTRRKWRFVRVFEALARLLNPLFPPLPLANPLKPPERILVTEYWNLGDLAILVPFLRNLRAAFPAARISLLINEGLESLLDGQGIVDEFIPARVPWARHFSRWRKYNPFSWDWISFARTILVLRKRRFDLAFSARMDVRDNLVLWLSGSRRRIAYPFGGGGCFLTDRVQPDLSRPHRADLWLQLLEAVAVLPKAEPSPFRLSAADAACAQQFLSQRVTPPGGLLVGIHPGARIATRLWGEDRFAEVARRLLKETDVHILWFSEPGRFSHGPALKRCHAVSLSFRPFLSLLSCCQVLLCNDSGPMHFANLLRVPVVAVFGPQKPEWFGPRGPHDRVVIRPEFSCRPCWDYCVFDQPYCLRAISVDEVYDAIQNQINDILKSERPRVPSGRNVELVPHA